MRVRAKEHHVVYLTQKDMKVAGLSIEKAIEVTQVTLKLEAEGKIRMSPSSYLCLPAGEKVGSLMSRQHYISMEKGEDNFGLFALAAFPANARRYGISRAMGFTILYDASTGVPLAIVDQSILNVMMTGALVGEVSKYLANEDSTRIGIIGAGKIAETSLLAIAKTLPAITKVRCYDIRKKAAKNYAERVKERLDIDVESVDIARDAIVGAEIIITATTANEPIVKNEWVKTKGYFYAHIGSGVEEEYNVVLSCDKIVSSHWDENKEHGTSTLARMYAEKLLTDDDVIELKEIVGGVKPGRETAEENIFFCPFGTGGAYALMAQTLYKNAIERNIGQRLTYFTKISF